MKTLFTCALAIAFINFAFAQKTKIIGNGKIGTQTTTIKQFNSLAINGSWAKVDVRCGRMPLVEITTDENIIQLIELNEDSGTLQLYSTKWIEPTSMNIVIQTPYLVQLTNEGWATIKVKGINSPVFSYRGTVGTICLAGNVKLLNIRSNQSDINIEQLKADTINVSFSGNGNLRYFDNPVINGIENTMQVKNAPKIVYVPLKIVNYKPSKLSLFVEGPPEKRFSYGFEIGPWGSKNESWPVGTKVYRLSDKSKSEIILEVQKEINGKSIRLN